MDGRHANHSGKFGRGGAPHGALTEARRGGNGDGRPAEGDEGSADGVGSTGFGSIGTIMITGHYCFA